MRLFQFLRKNRKKYRKVLWKRVGESPQSSKRYAPQGLTFVKGKLFVANTWNDVKSRIHVINPKNMKETWYFDMPQEALHTSGLCWDGKYVWAVDYRSNLLYKIDQIASRKSKRAKVLRSWPTGLRGTSACCIVTWKKKNYIVVSDFMRSDRTYFVDMRKLRTIENMQDAIAFSYKNEGFSQGLEFAKGFLFESENKLGESVINKMDVKTLFETQDAVQSTVMQLNGPNKGIEDLGWDGNHLWTSDEKSLSIYKSKV